MTYRILQGDRYGRHECGGSLIVMGAVTDTILELRCEGCAMELAGRLRGTEPESQHHPKPDYFEDF